MGGGGGEGGWAAGRGADISEDGDVEAKGRDAVEAVRHREAAQRVEPHKRQAGEALPGLPDGKQLHCVRPGCESGALSDAGQRAAAEAGVGGLRQPGRDATAAGKARRDARVCGPHDGVGQPECVVHRDIVALHCRLGCSQPGLHVHWPVGLEGSVDGWHDVNMVHTFRMMLNVPGA